MQLQLEAVFTSRGCPFTRAGCLVRTGAEPGRRTNTRISVFCAQYCVQLPLAVWPEGQEHEQGCVHVCSGPVSQVTVASGISSGAGAAA